MEQILLKHTRPGQCLSFDEYRSTGGFGALAKALGNMSTCFIVRTIKQIAIIVNSVFV